MRSNADLFASMGDPWNTPNWEGPQYYGHSHDRDTGESLFLKVRDPGFPDNPSGPRAAVRKRELPPEPTRKLDSNPRLKFNRLQKLARRVLES